MRETHAEPSSLCIRKLFSFLLLIIPLSLLFSACQPFSTQASSQPPVGQSGNWNMIFHDDFDGTSLDTSKWTTCYFNFHVGDGCIHDQDELELYQPGNVSVSNGILTLRAEKQEVDADNGNTYQYTSGMITTGPSSKKDNDTRFSFKYGYMEMRAKVPAGQGLWPAFWTLPTSLQWPPEIDVFEILGNAPNVVNMHYHYPNGSDDGGDSGVAWHGPDMAADWHTYAVDWEPDAITWYIDGVERRSYTDTSNIPNSPMYLLANLAVGGDWPGSPNASTPFPANFQIDYIRVWQKA